MIETTNTNGEIESLAAGDSPVSARRSTSAIEAFLANPYIHAAVLIAVVALCFGRTLSSYFLADDFGEISYVSRIFNGEPQLFWSNFTGNYMQIPGMNVYRPWLLVSLVLDFLLFKANATGYYFTNLASYTSVVLLVYFVARQLTTTWTRLRSCAAAFFGAVLFAANPLRCESVSWVVGRVDIVCCVFYLTSYLFFLKSRSCRSESPTKTVSSIALSANPARNLLVAAGVLSFFLAMGTKEMAIGLPGLLFVTEFFGIGKPGAVRTMVQRLRDAAIFSAPLWLSAALYFVIRYACLGTLGGGYVAGFGASQLSFMVQRWLDPDTLKRLFFPFCQSLFAGQTLYSELLTAAYGALLGIAAIRLFDRKISWQWFFFLVGWMATAAAPIFQLWGLGFDLEGSRFYFFLSIPICLAAPLLLFRPSSNTRSAGELKLLVATAVTLTATAAILGRTAALTDLEWVHAGKENRQVSISAQKLAEDQQSNPIAILGIPKERNGAHQILNGSTFDTMLNPPFTKHALAGKFETFDPIMFGPSEYIDASRFKRVMRKTNGKFFIWKTDSAKFIPASVNINAAPLAVVALPVADVAHGWLPHSHARAAYVTKNSEIQMSHMHEGDALRMDGLAIEPASADFLEFEYKAKVVPSQAKFVVYATGSNSKLNGISESQASADMVETENFKPIRIRLSKYWKWFCLGQINSLEIQPYPCEAVTMRNFKLVSADQICPSLAVDGNDADGTGVVYLQAPSAKLKLSPPNRAVSTDTAVSADRINSTTRAGASSYSVEVGKTNYFFNNFESVKDASPVAKSIVVPAAQTSVGLGPENFPQLGFYDVRARCIDAAGKPVGEYSDTVTLRLGRAQQVSK